MARCHLRRCAACQSQHVCFQELNILVSDIKYYCTLYKFRGHVWLYLSDFVDRCKNYKPRGTRDRIESISHRLQRGVSRNIFDLSSGFVNIFNYPAHHINTTIQQVNNSLTPVTWFHSFCKSNYFIVVTYGIMPFIL